MKIFAGADHASFANNDGSSGAVAWWLDATDDDTWREYANPYSVMGSGGLSSDEISSQYLIEGKIVFDWLDDSYIAEIEPYDDLNNSLCTPCGPYYLQPTDDGTLDDDGSVVGIQIAAQGTNIYLFIEYRSAFGGALLTWSKFRATNGDTGTYGNSVLVDATSDTDDLDDAIMYAGQSFVADFGTENNAGVRWVTIDVSSDAATGYLKVEIVSSDTSMPSSSPAPSTEMPTVAPSVEPCGDFSYCCDTLTLSGFSYTKMHATNSPDHYCCAEHCTYTKDEPTGDAYYNLQWVGAYSKYYITPVEFDACIADDFTYVGSPLTEDDISAACWDGLPTRAPSVNNCVADSTSWHKTGKPWADCEYVAAKISSRCDDYDEIGTSSLFACYSTCHGGCTPDDDDETPAPTPKPTPKPTVMQQPSSSDDTPAPTQQPTTPKPTVTQQPPSSDDTPAPTQQPTTSSTNLVSSQEAIHVSRLVMVVLVNFWLLCGV